MRAQLRPPLPGEYTVDISKDIGGTLRGVHSKVKTTKSIVIGKRARLLVVRVQTLYQCFRIVVTAPHQRFTGQLKAIHMDYVLKCDLKRSKFLHFLTSSVIATLGGWNSSW